MNFARASRVLANAARALIRSRLGEPGIGRHEILKTVHATFYVLQNTSFRQPAVVSW